MSESVAEVPITEARDRLADIANEAAYAGRATYLTRRGRRIAVVMPVESAEAAEAWEDAQLGRMADEAKSEMEQAGAVPIPAAKLYTDLGLD